MLLCVCLNDTVLIYFDIYSVCVFLSAFVFSCVWMCVRTSGGGCCRWWADKPPDSKEGCVWGEGNMGNRCNIIDVPEICSGCERCLACWASSAIDIHLNELMNQCQKLYRVTYWVWIGWACTRFAWRSRMFHVRAKLWIFATHSRNALNADEPWLVFSWSA